MSAVAAARQLTGKDLRRVLDLVHGMNEDDHDDELPVPVLVRMAAVLGADLLSYSGVELAAPRMVTNVCVPVEGCVPAMPGFGEVFGQHPVVAAVRDGRVGAGTAVAVSDLVDRRSQRRSPLYVDYQRPQRAEDQLVSVIHARGGHADLLVVNRSRPGFSRRDRAVLDLVSAYARQAVDRHRRRGVAAAIRRHAADLGRAVPELGSLTGRQRQVVDRLALGITDRQISRDLGISERTVHKHLENVYRRLGAANRTSLLAMLHAGG